MRSLLITGMLCLSLHCAYAARIAILLPQNGPWSTTAHAIEHGLLAAYYEDVTPGTSAGSLPSLEFYDTSTTPAVKLYQQALSNGAEAVIGPLLPADIAALRQHFPHVPVPTLVLQSGVSADNDNPLWSIGVDLQAEIQQQVRLARKNGIQQLAIIHSGDPQNTELSTMLQQLWQNQGGQIAINEPLPAHGSLASAVQNVLYQTEISYVLPHRHSHRHKKKHHHIAPVAVYTRTPRRIDALFVLTDAKTATALSWALRRSPVNHPVISLSSAWTPQAPGLAL